MPRSAPSTVKLECALTHADVLLIDGTITDASEIAQDDAEKFGWYNVSTFNEPYRVKEKKQWGMKLQNN